MRVYLIICCIGWISLTACDNSTNTTDTNSNKEDSEITTDTTKKKTKATPTTSLDWGEFIKIFPDINDNIAFDETLFAKNEGGGGVFIPYRLQNVYLGTDHQGYEEDDYIPTEVVLSAIGKIDLGKVWGLILLERAIVTDGRSQTYLLRTMTKEGALVAQEILAMSNGWQGGYNSSVGVLEKKEGQWQGNFYLKSVVDECDNENLPSQPYMQEVATMNYQIKNDGNVVIKSQQVFETIAETEEKIASYKTFESFELAPVSSESIGEMWGNPGYTENALAWEDKNGLNYVLFTKETREDVPDLSFSDKDVQVVLKMFHFIVNDNGGTLMSGTRDFVPLCDFDVYAGFIYPSVELTDLDADGFAELSFMYSLGCISDVSPVPVKLMLYEDGKKYAIRGNSRLSIDSSFGVDYKVDDSFKDVPASFLDFAKRQWEQYDKVY